MQNGIASGMVVGALLIAGSALAQTAGPSVGPGIVPLTGPSTASGLPELASPVTPGPIVAAVPLEAVKGAGVRAEAATASARKALKVAHKPGPKATVKKASAPKRVAKATARTAKPKHVASGKRPAPARQATVSAPIPLTRPQPSAKGSAPSKPVLPRV